MTALTPDDILFRLAVLFRAMPTVTLTQAAHHIGTTPAVLRTLASTNADINILLRAHDQQRSCRSVAFDTHVDLVQLTDEIDSLGGLSEPQLPFDAAQLPPSHPKSPQWRSAPSGR